MFLFSMLLQPALPAVQSRKPPPRTPPRWARPRRWRRWADAHSPPLWQTAGWPTQSCSISGSWSVLHPPLPGTNIQITVYSYKYICNTVKSFNFVGTKFCGLTIVVFDMFVDTWILVFQIICNITEENKYFVGILNSWIVRPTKYTKLNVQRIEIFHCYVNNDQYCGNIQTSNKTDLLKR